MKSRAKCRLHLRYSLVFKDFTYQGRLTKLNFFPPREQLKLQFDTNICSLQFGTPASLNTEALRKGEEETDYGIHWQRLCPWLFYWLFFLIKVPSKPKANWISPWDRSGVDHKGTHFITTDCYFLYTFLVVRFVSFRSFCFGHYASIRFS